MATPFPNQPQDPSDESAYLHKLIEQVQQGGPEAEPAFKKFHALTYSKISRFLGRDFRNVDLFTRDAALNAAYAILWERIKAIENAAFAVCYVKVTARRCVLAMLKSRERQKSLGENWRMGFDKILEDCTPAWKELETKEIVRTITRAIEKLKATQKAAVRAFMYHDSLVTAADSLSISPAAFRERLARAFFVLHRILRKDLGS